MQLPQTPLRQAPLEQSEFWQQVALGRQRLSQHLPVPPSARVHWESAVQLVQLWSTHSPPLPHWELVQQSPAAQAPLQHTPAGPH